MSERNDEADRLPDAAVRPDLTQDAPDPARRPPLVVTAGAALAAIVALVAAVWFGAGWVRAAFFTDGPRADARDTVLVDARQAAVNMMTVDPTDVEGYLQRVESSMTGQLLDETLKGQEQLRSAAEESATALEAKVLGAAVTKLNSERDHASALVVLEVTRNAPDVAPVSFRQSWALNLVTEGDVWKAEQAKPLGRPVTLGAPQPAAPPPPGVPEAPVPEAPAPDAPAPQPTPGS